MPKAIVIFLCWFGISSAFLPPPGCSSGFPKARALPFSSAASIRADPKELHFRPAMKTERGAIQEILLGMLMNPLSIDVDNFLCVEEEGVLVGFGQIRPIGGSDFELASVHVRESHRQRGIGSRLVCRLVDKFTSTYGSKKLGNLYLITLASTVPFYEKNRFSTIPNDDTPTVLRAERAVGSALQSLFGESVVCMRARC
ncbi:unnamed protein product [Hapterophycus canaliculatus]